MSAPFTKGEKEEIIESLKSFYIYGTRNFLTEFTGGLEQADKKEIALEALKRIQGELTNDKEKI